MGFSTYSHCGSDIPFIAQACNQVQQAGQKQIVCAPGAQVNVEGGVVTYTTQTGLEYTEYHTSVACDAPLVHRQVY